MVHSPEPIHRAREMSVMSSRKEFSVGNLERAMSQVSLRTAPRMQEPSPPRTPSPVQACFEEGEKKRLPMEGVHSSPRASSMAPSMQSITARNAKPGARRPTMLTTRFAYSDDSDEAVHDTTPSAKQPGSSARSVPFKAIALYDYSAKNTDELSFKEGDSVSVTDCSDGPWWYGSVAGKGSGCFPSNYVIA